MESKSGIKSRREKHRVNEEGMEKMKKMESKMDRKMLIFRNGRGEAMCLKLAKTRASEKQKSGEQEYMEILRDPGCKYEIRMVPLL